jgi:BlaI family transcriptional regulator, penicillinase repressor
VAISFTDRELDVMAILWERGSGTVAEIRELLEDDLAYTSVLSVVRVLEEKGYVYHEGEGKAHRYFPAVHALAAGRSALTRIVDKIFGGSPEILIAQLVNERKISAAEMKRLRKLIDERLKEEKP